MLYNNSKFWLFATICFVISTVFYAVGNGIINFATIFNAILLIVCIINLIVVNKKENHKKKTKRKK